jgi:phage gpG-like protein
MLKGLGQYLRDVARKVLGVGKERFAVEVSRMFHDDLVETFATATDPTTGSPWPPLKVRQGPILIDTGHMLRSALTASMQPTVNGNSMTWILSDPPYSAYHQFGTSRIPQRRFFALRQESITKLKSRLGQMVVDVIVQGP